MIHLRHFRTPFVFAQLRQICTSSQQNLPKIYTKTGDKGTTSTYTGIRLRKDDMLFDALGATDELSCAIGLAREFCVDSNLDITHRLEEIQCILQDIGSCLATPRRSATQTQLDKTSFNEHHVKDLERWIDDLTVKLPPLKNFILPSGGKASSSLHVARSACRSAERRVVSLYNAGEADEAVLKYLNRLSDYLFTAARFACHSQGIEERIYRKPIQPPQKSN